MESLDARHLAAEREKREKFSYRVSKVIDFPEQAIPALLAACDGFQYYDPTDIPDFVLYPLGFDRRLFGNADEAHEAFFEFVINESGSLNFQNGDILLRESEGRLNICHANLNLPLFSRILAAFLKEYKVEDVITLEAARLDAENDAYPENAFGGEVWVIGPGVVSHADTNEMGENLSRDMRKRMEDKLSTAISKVKPRM